MRCVYSDPRGNQRAGIGTGDGGTGRRLDEGRAGAETHERERWVERTDPPQINTLNVWGRPWFDGDQWG